MSRELLDLALAIESPRFTEAERLANPPPAKPYTIKSWRQIMSMRLPPKITYFAGIFALEQNNVVQGPGAVGKSRVTINVARNQVLGLPFCGLETHHRPLKWLFLGNENSIHRLQYDLGKMSKGLNAAQLESLDKHIFLQALETVDDSFICLSDEITQQRYQSTLASVIPDIVVVDPWGEIQYGDPNNDLDTRASLRDLVRVCRHVNQRMAIQIIHHSRTGRANIRQAEGWDRSNYGKGSKALYSSARAIINLAPADAEDTSRIVIACGKANDCRPFETRGIVLDEETMTYDLDPDFDLEAWRNDVDGKMAPKSQKVTVRDVVDCCQSPVSKAALVESLTKTTGCSSPRAYEWVKTALKAGVIEERGKGLVTTGKFKGRKSLQTATDEAHP